MTWQRRRGYLRLHLELKMSTATSLSGEKSLHHVKTSLKPIGRALNGTRWLVLERSTRLSRERSKKRKKIVSVRNRPKHSLLVQTIGKNTNISLVLKQL